MSILEELPCYIYHIINYGAMFIVGTGLCVVHGEHMVRGPIAATIVTSNCPAAWPTLPLKWAREPGGGGGKGGNCPPNFLFEGNEYACAPPLNFGNH